MRGEFSFKRNFLFDLDGTLVDSTVAHAQAYLDALRPRHSELAATFQYARVAGQSTRQVFSQMGIVEPELTALTQVEAGAFSSGAGPGRGGRFSWSHGFTGRPAGFEEAIVLGDGGQPDFGATDAGNRRS